MQSRLLPLLLLLTLLLGGCATVDNGDTDDGAGFSGFRDYGWQTGY